MNEIQVTIRGNVTSDPRQVQFDDGNVMTSFRLASNSRRFDYQTREWVSTGTTFVNVNCRRSLATNVAKSLTKGQPVIVNGRLRERTWEANGRSGRSLEVDADGLGHDLAWGTSDFTRVVRVERVRTPEEEQAARMAAEVDEQVEMERESDELDVELKAELDAEFIEGMGDPSDLLETADGLVDVLTGELASDVAGELASEVDGQPAGESASEVDGKPGSKRRRGSPVPTAV